MKAYLLSAVQERVNPVPFTTSAEDSEKVAAAVGKVKLVIKSIKQAGKTSGKTGEQSQSEKQNGIIGNTQYKFIKNKTYHKHNNDTAEKIAATLEAQGVKFSGKVDGDITTLTIGTADLPKYTEIRKNMDKKPSLTGRLNDKREKAAELNANREKPDKPLKKTVEEL